MSKQVKKTGKKNAMPNKSKILQAKPSSAKIKGQGGFFSDAGKWLGEKAGGWLSKVVGFGDYDVKYNTISKPNGPPIFTNTKSATRIQHREYIKDIVGSTGFNLERFQINPGVSTTFPWLSGVADSFEQYNMHGLLFEFKSTSAVALNSTNTALGTVIMATEYNSNLPNFTAKRDMENHVYSGSAPPSQTFLHPIECAPSVNVLSNMYVRSIPTPDSDLRLSDIGAFQLATVGMQAEAVIGELWVTYDVELLKPKLPDSYSNNPPAHYQVPIGDGEKPSSSNYFGTVDNQYYKLMGVGLSPVSLEGRTISFKSTGSYIINVLFACTSSPTATVDLTGTTSTTGPIILDKILLTGSDSEVSGYQSPESGPGIAGFISYTIAVTVSATDPLITAQIHFASDLPNVYASDLFVTCLPAGFTLRKARNQIEYEAQMRRIRQDYDTILRALGVSDRAEIYTAPTKVVQECYVDVGTRSPTALVAPATNPRSKLFF